MKQKKATREQIESFMESQRVWREREEEHREREREQLTTWLHYKAARHSIADSEPWSCNSYLGVESEPLCLF
jgi:hypothetical protein